MDEVTGPRRKGRPATLVGAVVLVVVVVVAGLVLWRGWAADDGADRDELLAPGGSPPPDVVEATGALTADGEGWREVLSPGVVDLLPAGEDRLLQPGSRLELAEDGWRSEIDGFGGARGHLVPPDGPPVPVEIGLAEVDGAWRVTYVLVGEGGPGEGGR